MVNGGGGEGRRGDLANGNFYKFLLPLNLGHCLPGPGWPALTQFTFNQAAQPEDRRGLERTGEKENKYFASLDGSAGRCSKQGSMADTGVEGSQSRQQTTGALLTVTATPTIISQFVFGTLLKE